MHTPIIVADVGRMCADSPIDRILAATSIERERSGASISVTSASVRRLRRCVGGSSGTPDLQPEEFIVRQAWPRLFRKDLRQSCAATAVLARSRNAHTVRAVRVIEDSPGISATRAEFSSRRAGYALDTAAAEAAVSS